MRISSVEIMDSLESARIKTIGGLIVLIIVFTLIQVPRGEHLFGKMKYNLSLYAYVTSLVLVAAGVAAVLNAALLRFYRHVRPSDAHRLDWLIWGMVGGAFVWLGVDKMFAVHERMAFWMIETFDSLRNMDPSMIDGFVLATYGLFALPIGLILMKRLLWSSTARKYFVWGLIFMAGAVGHDATERFLDYGMIWIVDSEIFEKLFQILTAWAFTAAFISTATALMERILGELPTADTAPTMAVGRDV